MRRVFLAITLLAIGGSSAAAAGKSDTAIPFIQDETEAKQQGITMPTAPISLHPYRDPYPTLSRREGEEGTVVVSFVVNVDGTVSDARVEKSSGHARLDNAALENVEDERFHPATRNGVPIAIRMKLATKFDLSGGTREAQPSGWEVFPMWPSDFPAGARDKGESGVTTLLVSVDTEGHFTQITVSHSSGYADLDQAAEKVARGWKVTPAAVNGIKVKTVIPAAFVWQRIFQ